MKPILKILVANRGEIAVRIIRACREMGIATVAVYSEADQQAVFVQQADEAVAIGPAPATESYLHIETLINAAQRTGADAVHPGYGFLSENTAFAQACEAAGLLFIGPSVAAIQQMGDKNAARQYAQRYGVPVVPGYDGADQSTDTLTAMAETIGFPLLIKAAAGGGGKGMRRVEQADSFRADLAAAQREALAAFGNPAILLEKYLEPVRHIEIQIIADQHGSVVHAFERECSIQRRYQKIIEEAPAPGLLPTLREQMTQAAITLANGIGYVGLGTVEFAVTPDERFYFLEMNTRLQVEHPVTEAVTGLDLLQLQIQLAEGQPLPFQQSDLKLKGHAIEVRLYAEDPSQQFRPMAGSLQAFSVPTGSGLRCDTGVESGSVISMYYDPLLAKVIAHGPERITALRRLQRAVCETVALGIPTNQALLQRILAHPAFVAGQLDTHFVHHFKLTETVACAPEQVDEIALVATLWQRYQQERIHLNNLPAGWRNNAYPTPPTLWQIGSETRAVGLISLGKEAFQCQIGEAVFTVTVNQIKSTGITCALNGLRRTYHVVGEHNHWLIQQSFLGSHEAVQVIPGQPQVLKQTKGTYTMPMTGKICQVLVGAGQTVSMGEPLVILESMKMETTVMAATNGMIKAVHVAVGEVVSAGKTLLEVEPT